MIIIEASHVNNGGSFTLLKFLLKELEQRKYFAIVYVKYEHIYENLLACSFCYIEVRKTSLIRTIYRYMQKNDNVLFFCSLPPFVHCSNSYVYFHSEYYSCKPVFNMDDKSFFEKVKSYIYYYWINKFKNNVQNFFCQTSLVEDNLRRTYGLHPLILPFYSLPIVENNFLTKEYDFFYPAIGAIHKNHILLFEAFEELLSHRHATLAITISEHFENILYHVDKMNAKYPHSIVNLGYCDEKQLSLAYRKSKALIFPSTMESFGLPLIEALAYGLKVMSSDLEYSYKVISNPIVFNPNSPSDIAMIMNNYLDGKYEDICQEVLVENKMDLLMDFLHK